jgi:cell fate regulator YaaT (PSP1 superfamily)
MNITTIKLRNSYQMCFADTNNLFIKSGSPCIVETEHGIDIGKVCRRHAHVQDKDVEIKGKLLRIPIKVDLDRIPEIESLEKKAYNICRDKAKEKNLDMKLVSVKCLFDKTKIIFYFVAENRIDFRELVKDLASILRTRIEMRQIGVRDESRLIGGFGSCGRELCCTHMKEEFDPVSIKMAKEQNLNLNSLKISGMCGRLLCCLSYEYNVYKDIFREFPKTGTEIKILEKTYIVEHADPMKQIMKIRCGEHIVEVTNSDMSCCEGRLSLSEKIIKRIANDYEEEFGEGAEPED